MAEFSQTVSSYRTITNQQLTILLSAVLLLCVVFCVCFLSVAITGLYWAAKNKKSLYESMVLVYQGMAKG